MPNQYTDEQMERIHEELRQESPMFQFILGLAVMVAVAAMILAGGCMVAKHATEKQKAKDKTEAKSTWPHP